MYIHDFIYFIYVHIVSTMQIWDVFIIIIILYSTSKNNILMMNICIYQQYYTDTITLQNDIPKICQMMAEELQEESILVGTFSTVVSKQSPCLLIK